MLSTSNANILKTFIRVFKIERSKADICITPCHDFGAEYTRLLLSQLVRQFECLDQLPPRQHHAEKVGGGLRLLTIVSRFRGFGRASIRLSTVVQQFWCCSIFNRLGMYTSFGVFEKRKSKADVLSTLHDCVERKSVAAIRDTWVFDSGSCTIAIDIPCVVED